MTMVGFRRKEDHKYWAGYDRAGKPLYQADGGRFISKPLVTVFVVHHPHLLKDHDYIEFDVNQSDELVLTLSLEEK